MGENDFPKNATTNKQIYPSEINLIYNKSTNIYFEFEQLSLSVSSSNSNSSYTSPMVNHLIKNIGTVECYINFEGVATTSSYSLKPFEVVQVEGEVSQINAITSSGTTTLRIIGQK